MVNINLQSALKYRSMGFSIIPVKKDKRPYIGWANFQKSRPSEKQIRQWWGKWPGANIGIVTGKISGLTVIDADSEAGLNALNEFLPDSLTIPIVKTPKGNHLYFKHSPGLSNGVRIIKDTDLRTDGGYIIAPPSKTDYQENGKREGGTYKWAEGLRITETHPPDMPDMLLDILKSGATSTRALASAYNIDNTPSLEGANIAEKYTANNKQHVPTIANIRFEKGCRDQALFHLSNHLVKGGMPVENI